MTTHISRDRVEAYLDALASRDPDRIGPFLADDIDWLLTGPTEAFPYCGQRLGKEAVLDAYRLLGRSMRVTQHVREQVLIDGDQVAALVRLAGMHETGREITLRFATFTRFRDGLVAEVYTILDVLGVVEQMIGRPLDIPLVPNTPELVEIEA
jgi:ketosteroid isomerase-like protein